MWRRLLRRTHPDHGGEHDLFIWVKQLFDNVAGDAPEDKKCPQSYQRRQPPPHYTAGERVDFTAAREHESFETLTAHAVSMASEAGEPYARLLRLLASCYPASEADTARMRAQNQGASYKSLAYAAHLSSMTKPERVRWYRVCEQIPLSQRHIGHIIAELQARMRAA